MKVAVMQPYFFPYIGYFQLIGAVDLFIVYDNIQYTKKGWINRNRMLQNGTDVTFSLPLKKDSDYLDVRERRLAEDFKPKKLINRIRAAYHKAPNRDAVMPLIEDTLLHDATNLFDFLHYSLKKTCEFIGIKTEFRTSSEVPIDHALKSQDKVLAFCDATDARTYINAIGGVDLYSKEAFRARNIELAFIKPKPFDYPQLGKDFVPWLSIIDVMMFNPLDTVRQSVLSNYDLV